MKEKYTVILVFLVSVVLTNSNYYAQQRDSVPVPENKTSKFTFSGYVDFNYFKNLNNPRSGSNLGLSGSARAFDQKENQFQLGLAQTKITYTRAKSDVMIDLTFGPHADLGNYGNVIGPLGNGYSSSSIAIKQAYFNYKFTKKFTFTAGQFGTHVCYEFIDAPLNYNYSLSNLFNNGPFYHLGIKGSYALNKKIIVMAGIVNNWDNLYDNNKFKTAIAQVNVLVSNNFTVIANYIGGHETTNSASYRNHIRAANDSLSTNNFKQLLDLIITYKISPKFTLAINAVAGALNGKQTSVSDTTKKVNYTNNWGGVALYLNYQFTKKFGLGIRSDFFDNTAGVMYIGKTDVHSTTLTGRFSLDEDHLFIKPEVRMDIYKKLNYTGPSATNIQQFEDSKGYFTKNSQITVGMAFVYVF